MYIEKLSLTAQRYALIICVRNSSDPKVVRSSCCSSPDSVEAVEVDSLGYWNDCLRDNPVVGQEQGDNRSDILRMKEVDHHLSAPPLVEEVVVVIVMKVIPKTMK